LYTLELIGKSRPGLNLNTGAWFKLRGRGDGQSGRYEAESRRPVCWMEADTLLISQSFWNIWVIPR